MSPELSDPPEAPEPGATRTKPRELLNQPIILLPTGLRIAHDPKKQEDFEVVDCHYWVLDRSGIVTEGDTGISWWRAREQLRQMKGQYIACRPVQGDDNSISLERLSGAAREVAAKAVASLSTPPIPDDEPPPDDDFSDEPF